MFQALQPSQPIGAKTSDDVLWFECPDKLQRSRTDLAVLSSADDLLKELGRAGRTGIYRKVEDRIIHPGREGIASHRIPVFVLVDR